MLSVAEVSKHWDHWVSASSSDNWTLMESIIIQFILNMNELTLTLVS